MSDEETLNKAAEAAARSAGIEVGEDVLDAAKNQAKEMVQDGRADGLVDVQNLFMAVGLRVARLVLTQMVREANLRGAEKSDALRRIGELSPITEHVCQKVDFYNVTTMKPDAVYIVLDECPRAHDMGRELEKLKQHVGAEQWKTVMGHLSVMIFHARYGFKRIMAENADLVRSILHLPRDNPCAAYLDLRVDLTNSTLYVDPEWGRRIGVFLRRG